MELAILGSVILVVLAAMLRYGQMLNSQQEAQIYAFRKAVQIAQGNGDPMSMPSDVSLTVMQEMYPVDLGGYNANTSYASASASVSIHPDSRLMEPDEEGDAPKTLYQVGRQMIQDNQVIEMPLMKVKPNTEPRSFEDSINFSPLWFKHWGFALADGVLTLIGTSLGIDELNELMGLQPEDVDEAYFPAPVEWQAQGNPQAIYAGDPSGTPNTTQSNSRITWQEDGTAAASNKTYNATEGRQMHFVMQQDAAQIKEDSWDGEYYAIDSVEEIPPDVAVTTNQETEKHRSWTTPHE